MKKILKNLVFLLIIVNSLNSQNVFNFTDFTITPGENIKSVNYALASNTISQPSEGAKKIWDYANIPQTGTDDNLTFISNPKKGEFDNANYIINTLYTIGSIPTNIITREYYNINANGYEQLGLYHDSTFLKLDANGTANVIVPYQKANFTPSIRSVYKYPFDISLAQNNFPNVRRSTNFFLNYPPFYTNAPSSFMRSVTRNIKTVGWGNLKLPNQKNTFPCVLVKSVEVTVDSVFINGLPAPDALLQQFSIVQGGSNTFTKYEYWSKGNNIPVLAMMYINSNPSVNITLKSNLSNSNTSVEELNLINSIVSPNPVQNGSTKLTLEKQSAKRWYLVICDETGRILKTDNIDGIGSINQQINLDNNSNSILFYSVLNEEFNLVSSGSLINKK